MKKPTWRMYRRAWGQSPVEETEDELQFHFAMRTDELMQRGLSEEEAHARVQREFGDVTHIRRELLQLGAERVRRMRRMELRDGLRQDCATGLRALVRHRAFAALAIGTLAPRRIARGHPPAHFRIADPARTLPDRSASLRGGRARPRARPYRPAGGARRRSRTDPGSCRAAIDAAARRRAQAGDTG